MTGLVELHPEPGRAIEPLIDVTSEARPGSTTRPWVLSNMVSSLDGATALAGTSGGLGGPADKAVFRGLRAVADVIIAGATTVSVERYRVPDPDPDVRAARRAAGRSERARIVVITGSLSLDPSLPLFDDPDHPPLIITTEDAPPERRAELGERSEIIDAGRGRVDLSVAVRLLGEAGHRVVLAEGGPSLNGQLIDDGLLDEWNLSLSPILAAGSSDRAAHSRSTVAPSSDHWDLARLWTGQGLLFGRWLSPSAPT